VGERDLGVISLPPLWLTWDLAGRGRWLTVIRPLLGKSGRQGRALGEAPISLTDHDTDGLTPLGRQALSLRPPLPRPEPPVRRTRSNFEAPS
jgi:hypothetical protein